MTISESNTTDYHRIERAIRYLDARSPTQPSLDEVARHVGLSPFHFQRLFTRWAGISPKRFSQMLALGYAKDLLRRSRNLLDATYDAGLSSGGRLHDLFVTLEAVTPGEYRTSGSGLRISAGFHDTPFGECLLAITDRGICGLSFFEGARTSAIADLAERWPNATIEERPRATASVARRIFTPLEVRDPAGLVPLALLVRGTNFQVKVWEALLRVPAGTVTTYEDVAASIGEPRAVRAVGTAAGRNPVAFVIPCHRVLRNTGALGGYRWGQERKRAMLAWEGAQRSRPFTAQAAGRAGAQPALAG
jgi:AraC family transcriptional regulator, regulatory protein of adaptative response / methylated-DNA-[protein]-cysteine methyltransferase